MARAPVSKTGCSRFESWSPCCTTSLHHAKQREPSSDECLVFQNSTECREKQPVAGRLAQVRPPACLRSGEAPTRVTSLQKKTRPASIWISPDSTGCSSAWQSACFGSRKSHVQIVSSRRASEAQVGDTSEITGSNPVGGARHRWLHFGGTTFLRRLDLRRQHVVRSEGTGILHARGNPTRPR